MFVCFFFQSNTSAIKTIPSNHLHVLSTQEIAIQTDDNDIGIQVAKEFQYVNERISSPFFSRLECHLSQSSVYCHIFSKFIPCSLVYSIVKMIY